MAASKVSLKLLIDTKHGKVLFAEAGKEFVDFLFNILSMPIATVISIISKKEMVGSIANLYESVENLSDTFLEPNQNKETLLKTKVSYSSINTPFLWPTIASSGSSSSSSTTFYRCNKWDAGNNNNISFGAFGSRDNTDHNGSNNCKDYISSIEWTICPSCKNCMNSSVVLVNPPVSKSDETGYVKGVVTYMVMDDLVVTPMSAISCISMLNKLNIIDIGNLEEKVINLGVDEVVNLLKTSLKSNQVLTDVFLNMKGEN